MPGGHKLGRPHDARSARRGAGGAPGRAAGVGGRHARDPSARARAHGRARPQRRHDGHSLYAREGTRPPIQPPRSNALRARARPDC